METPLNELASGALLLSPHHAAQLRELQGNEFVRLVLEHTPLAVAVSLGAEHRLVLLNPAAEKLLGLPATGVVGRLPEEIVPETLNSARPVLDRVYATGQVETIADLSLKLPDGRGVILEVTYAPLFGTEGQPIGVMHLALDQTERRRLVEQLQAERTFLQTVLQQMPGGVLIAEASGKIVFRNFHDGVLPTGVHPTDVSEYQRFGSMFSGPQHTNSANWPISRALRGEVVSGEEMTFHRADGSPGTLRASAAPIRDSQDQIIAAVTTWFDISNRKRLEDKLSVLAEAGAALGSSLDYEATLGQLAQLVVPRLADWCTIHMANEEGVLRAVAVAHVDPVKTEWAREITRRFPPNPKNPQGLYRVLRTGEPDLVPEITDEMLELTQQNPEYLEILRRLGLHSSMMVPLSARGRTLGVLTFLTTAESRARYNEEDLALAQELAHRAALAVDNARLYSELREMDQRKDEFLAMLAHELRNPLAPIRNALHLLRPHWVADPTAERLGAMMERQVSHMVRLVDDLLDVSRITRGKIELRPEPVELTPAVSRAVETVRAALEQREHRLELRLPPEPLWLSADPARLEQVLGNLLSNAVKYTPMGGRIRLWADGEANRAVIRVRDTGIGIRPENLTRIFDLFAQGDQVAGRVQEGLGIGLTLVRQLLEMHGGSIHAFSAGLGLGSEFVVRWPLAERGERRGTRGERQETLGSRPSSLAPRPSSRRVLVVDDNEDAAESCALLLRTQGYEVHVVHDGPTALAAAAEFHPDAVLLDIGLPHGMSGYEVARHLRQMPGLDRALIVAITGYGQEEDRRRAREAGFSVHLTKPVEWPQLVEVLAKVQS